MNCNIKLLIENVQKCNSCLKTNNNQALQINHKEIGLSYYSPIKIPINIMFLAESPPKLGNGFFYDMNYPNSRFRNKLFSLINQADLGIINTLDDFNYKGYYLADAINCRWDKTVNNNLPEMVFKNCSIFLQRQIKLLKPKYIVAMGNYAHNSTTFPNINSLITQLKIQVIKISFILTASNETDLEKIEKLKSIKV